MSQKQFSKSQAVAIFKRDILPGIIGHRETNGVIDKGARGQAWNDFTHYLFVGECITERQYDTWQSPRCCEQ